MPNGIAASSITRNPLGAMIEPAGTVYIGPKKLLSMNCQPDRSTAAAVGLKSSIQPSDVSPFGWTSLMRIFGAVATVIARDPVLPSMVAVIVVVPGAIPKMRPVVGLIAATSGLSDVHATAPEAIGSPF